MQSSFAIRGDFFRELAQLVRSGIPLPRSLEILSQGRGAGHLAKAVAASLAAGTVAAFRQAGFPEGDCAVVEAGESTGRLEQVFAELGDHYSKLAAARKMMISKSLYPILMLHLAPVLLTIPGAIIDGGGYAWRLAISLGGIYLVVAVIVGVWIAMRHLFVVSSSAARIVVLIPFVGPWMETWSAARFASVFSLFVRSGGRLLRGIELAGAASGSSLLEGASRDAIASVRSGGSLAPAFQAMPGVPELLERALRVGEHSGRLDEESLRAANALQERAFSMLDAVSEWLPKIIYFAMVFYTGWMILSMVGQVTGAMGNALDQ